MSESPESTLPSHLQDALNELVLRHRDSETLQAQVDNLIAQHGEHGQALRAAYATLTSLQFGPYRVIDVLGSGGFGIVYRAEQVTGVKRVVALKVLRLELSSQAVLQRFERERRVLARLNHDGIARFYEAGAAAGEPWFAMELVHGEKLTDYCDRQRLSIPERLRLFRQVCEAVQYAHTSGIVHRDLKPSNVLAAEVDGKHVAKVIDFGIARVAEDDGEVAVPGGTLSRQGMMIGTPEYMAPEQARGDTSLVNATTDVYALGVILYELVTGTLPIPSDLLRNANGDANLAVIPHIVCNQEPEAPSARVGTLTKGREDRSAQRRVSVTAWSRALRGDLDVIVGKALEKDPERRYRTVVEFAEDVRRHLDNEPIQAQRPTRVYRLTKFVRRYRGQVAAAGLVVIALTIGAVATLVQWRRAQGEATRNKVLAEEKGRTVDNFNQLSAVVRLEDVLAKQNELWPPWPDKAAALKSWLDHDCADLLAMRPQIEATIKELRSKAVPLTPEQVEADRRASPAWPAYERQQQLVASLRRAQAIRAGTAKLELPELPAALRDADAMGLNSFAWARVAPEKPDGEKVDRTTFGEEAVALVAAQEAVAKSAETAEAFQFLDKLAWALLANGQDDEAKQRTAEALAKAPAKAHDDYVGYQQAIEAAIAEAAARVTAAEAKLAELNVEVSARRTWTFGSDAESESARFLHDALVSVRAGLDSMAAKEKVDVEQRLTWAQQVRVSLAHPKARVTWAEARAAIAKADDVVASKLYAGISIPLPDEAVIGLVPIGMNPTTKLWEFYDLRSAWDGRQAATDIDIPVQEADGRIVVKDGTGIVFVLLPGGKVTLGSQNTDPKAPFYDPQRADNETLHEVTLSPFFMARHEMTKGQWSRLWTWNAQLVAPSFYRAGQYAAGKRITWANPVEGVDWPMCDLLLTRYRMVLPTEAQWEYACRGGTTTAWNVDFKQLENVANMADATAKEAAPQWLLFESWSDGHLVHAPVGTFAANALGLYDVHGNVLEWCLDFDEDYGGERVGDGQRKVGRYDGRINRGGSFGNPAVDARSACRSNCSPTIRADSLGLRPSRSTT